ncbi:Or33c, partial [Drosophila busckii]
SSVINSASFIGSHWRVWTVVGAAPYTQFSWQGLYCIYAISINLLVTLCFPLHLGAKLFSNAAIIDDLKNLTNFVATISCSLKIIFYAYNLQQVRHMEQLLAILDTRIQGSAQRQIYNQMCKQLRSLIIIFACVCVLVSASAELSFVFQAERKLLYPGWFPFDWQHSTLKFYAAHVYQIGGISLQIAQNYASDSFPVVLFCLTSAHIQMLYKRIEQLGVGSELEVETELEACITDHKHLLELFATLESLISWPVFIQFGASALNICISIAAMLFFVTEPMARVSFFFYALAMPMQIFPTCYYATDAVLWFGKLHYAAFSCNWLTQQRSFKCKLMLFVERSLRNDPAKAGGMVGIHVNAIFGTLKLAYSLFTLILRMQ